MFARIATAIIEAQRHVGLRIQEGMTLQGKAMHYSGPRHAA
jgi:hypothetical protein